MARTAVIFEANPRPPQAWQRDVCAQVGLTFIEPDAVAEAMAADPAVREALLGQAGESPALAKQYQQGLDAVAKAAPKVALHSVSWLLYGQPAAAVVVDLAGVEDERLRGERLGLPAAEVAKAVGQYRAALDARLAKFGVAPGRRLMLEAGLTDAQKVERTVAFLAPLLRG